MTMIIIWDSCPPVGVRRDMSGGGGGTAGLSLCYCVASAPLMESDGTLYPPTPPSPTFSPASFTTIFMLDVLIV